MRPDKSAEKYFEKKFRKSKLASPIATIAYYGPDDQTATKVAVGIVDSHDKVIEMKRWLVRALDVRIDREINNEILAFLKDNHVKRVAMTGRIIGCPHEEGIDYPEGSKCPKCPYWAKIDRWTGKILT
ncbi:MAG: hypothetical protein M1470_12775 [Bacteroidetes bacterium]|nr:hypothetical protein [Bacteroidota bacterium]MCL5738867.1 hypothetical protein [Bacteroidota bacterium]